MEKKPEIIPLLPYHANAQLLNVSKENENSRENAVPSTGKNLKLDKYQVVRKEFMPHSRELALTFSDMHFSVNQQCLRRFPNHDTVLTLIDPEEKLMVLLPCPENTPNAFRWCGYTRGKRIPRRGANTVLYGMIFDLMRWDLESRYKVLGSSAQDKEQPMLVFDLKQAETYPRQYSGERRLKTSRTAQYPAAWREQFGVTYGEHAKMVNVKLLGEYSLFTAVRGTRAETEQTETTTSSDEMREEVTQQHE